MGQRRKKKVVKGGEECTAKDISKSRALLEFSFAKTRNLLTEQYRRTNDIHNH